MKGISSLVSFMAVLAVMIVGIGIITGYSGVIVSTITSSTDVRNADILLRSINNAVLEVAHEGKDAARIISFTAPKQYETIPEENAIQFRTETSSRVQDYLSRVERTNIVTIAGNDVNCFEKDDNGDGRTDLVLENSYIKGVFQKVSRTAPLSQINTTGDIIMLLEKTSGTNITFSNSSIMIDDDPSTSMGVGYSEISKSGLAMPFCRVHFFINSTVNYDVYYNLYAGADFFDVEVDNIG